MIGMSPSPRRSLASVLVGGVLLAASAAQANVVWPPAVYFYTIAVWWVIAGGLIVEFVVHFLVLQMAAYPLARMVILSNLASTLIGLLLTWPLVFWEVGVTRLAAIGLPAIVGVLVVIFVVNVLVEYLVGLRWLGVQRNRRALVSFALANAGSYALVVWVALSGALADT